MLSKSNYLTFLKHPAWLWLIAHEPDKIPKHDADTLAIFSAGHRFEEYAEHLFIDGYALGYNVSGHFDWKLYQSLPERTAEALQGEHKLLFQGRIEVDGLTCIFDVLERTAMGTFNLYEIKSSSSAKREHEYDLAFQTYVLEKSGITIEKISVIHVNGEYVRDGKVDSKQIADETEVTNAVRSLMLETEENISKALAVIASPTMPDPSPRFARNGAFYEWLEIYEATVGEFPEYSVYSIAGIGARKAGELEDIGAVLIGDIPEDFTLTTRQQSQVIATKRNERHIDTERITEFMGMMQYPLYFLDYETFSSVIPPFDGLRPYQQVPFQYSLHILEDPNAPLRHKEYLHTENTLPVRELLAQMAQDIGPEGTVLVWHESFEKGRNVEMASLAPEYNTFLYGLNDRVIDLKTPFSQEWFVDKDFFGSASIKAVLPVLAPDLTYKELAIQGGNTAQRIWMELVQQGFHQDKRDEILNDLLKYCHLDTLAMVRIWKYLYQLSQGENPDASRAFMNALTASDEQHRKSMHHEE
ncbi:DUF2779 domain-containing protein [Patescibacteria group bacterium]|nr:DUF2779 domain-containing protein [Patescibacteria group bacterium]